MRTDQRISCITHCIIGAILIALLGVASVYDLQISDALSDGSSFFGALFVSLGELPAYIICPIAGMIIFYSNTISAKQRIATKIIGTLIVLGGYLTWCLLGSRHSMPPHALPIYIVYALLFTGVTLWVGRLIGSDKLSRYTRWAMFAVLVLVVTLVLTRIVKISWGRMRYRDMLANGDFTGYTPWYLPQGYRKGDYTSFISGHTAHACNIFVFSMLIDYSPGYKRFRAFAYGGGILFVVLTALSRIVYNAHFLSDVVVGGALSYLAYYALRKAVFRKNIGTSMTVQSDNLTAE